MENKEAVVGEGLLSKLVALRRDIHQHPEIGFKEFRTQGLIKQTLLDAGIEPSAIKVIRITYYNN